MAKKRRSKRCLEGPSRTAAGERAEAAAILGEGLLQERDPDLLAQRPREDGPGDAVAQVAGEELVHRHCDPPEAPFVFFLFCF